MKNNIPVRTMSAIAVLSLSSPLAQYSQDLEVQSDNNLTSKSNIIVKDSKKTIVFNLMIENSKKIPFDHDTVCNQVIG